MRYDTAIGKITCSKETAVSIIVALYDSMNKDIEKGLIHTALTKARTIDVMQGGNVNETYVSNLIEDMNESVVRNIEDGVVL